jgi:predicted MFS family arabinose efflux permease
MTAGRLILTLCLAEVVTMTPVFAFPALLPLFVDEWSLSHAQAGWIAGIYFVGYAAAAPLLLTLTDRIDARRVYIGGALLTAVSAAGFAAIAEGFWQALALRGCAGIGLAATYMPGLKMLVDRYQGSSPSRAVALYTSSFSLGTALSYFLAGEITAEWGWRTAFATTALATVLALLLVLQVPARPSNVERSRPPLLDFRPILRNRPAMGYILAYGIHCWELFTWRSWLVAFLAAGLALRPDQEPPRLTPTTVATLSGLVAMLASLAGNELAVRFGRPEVITGVMLVSATAAFGLGFTVDTPYALASALALAYTALVMMDSAALTAGAVAVAAPDRRGATMALHALIGFAGAGIGPVLFGVVLDGAGTDSPSNVWGMAFVSVGLLGLLGPLALRLSLRS